MRPIKLRKDRQCDYCFDAHEMVKGKIAYYEEGKCPRYDKNDNQIGIVFYKNYACLTCYNEITQPIYDPDLL